VSPASRSGPTATLTRETTTLAAHDLVAAGLAPPPPQASAPIVDSASPAEAAPADAWEFWQGCSRWVTLLLSGPSQREAALAERLRLREAAQSTGAAAGLAVLCARLELTEIEALLLEALAVAAFDPAVHARLGERIEQRHATGLLTVGQWSDLLVRNADEWAALRYCFRPGAPLLAHGVAFLKPSWELDPLVPLRARVVGLREEVLDALLDPRRFATQAPPGLRLREPEQALDELVLPPELAEQAGQVELAPSPTEGPARVALIGPRHSGRTCLGMAVAAAAGLPLWEYAVQPGATVAELAQRLQVVGPQVWLRRGALLLSGLDDLTPGPGQRWLDSAQRRLLLSTLDALKVPLLLRMEPGLFEASALDRPRWSHWRLYHPGADEIERWLLRHVPDKPARRELLRQVQSRTLTWADAQRWRQGDFGELPSAPSRPIEDPLLQPIAARFALEDLIVDDEIREQILEVADAYSHQDTVFNDWGMQRLFQYGRGLTALMSGPPGTGKTMTASIIATRLGLALYRVDLSKVVDKYIGESEKRISRIFDEAQRFPCVLLFDEADSLFGSRTAIRSSTDRYANLEVNYILQRVEDFTGVLLLTTNFEKNIDEAFKRRIRYHVEFPFPDAAQRELLWEAFVPDKHSERVDCAALAEEYELSGGNIKNAVLRAAFGAASDGRRIDQEDLAWAAEQEYLKIGRLV